MLGFMVKCEEQIPMELGIRQAAFVLDVMDDIENAESSLPSEKSAAREIRQRAEAALTE